MKLNEKETQSLKNILKHNDSALADFLSCANILNNDKYQLRGHIYVDILRLTLAMLKNTQHGSIIIENINLALSVQHKPHHPRITIEDILNA